MPIERLIDLTPQPPAPNDLYANLTFPEPPEDRPYLYLNMVSTADGKIVIGDLGGSAVGVGGATDQLLFRRLQTRCDAAMIGGSTLRASHVLYPPSLPRFVVTRSGNLPFNNRFFTDAPDRAYVLAPTNWSPPANLPNGVPLNVLPFGTHDVDLPAALKWMREQLNIRTLLCEGGAVLNDILLRQGLVDELFLTIAPKLKGGNHLPTVVDGTGFPSGSYLSLKIVSLYRDEDEVYFRYKICDEDKTSG